MIFPARWIFTMEDENPLRENILFDPNADIPIKRMTSAGKDKRSGKRMILPFLVNAHTHLELSVLKGKVGPDKSFVNWLKEVNAVNAGIRNEEKLKKMEEALTSCYNYGTGILFDICNNIDVWDNIVYDKIPMHMMVYHEILGFDPDVAEERLHYSTNKTNQLNSTSNISFHPTPHSLYSCSYPLLETVKEYAADYSLSIHLAEHDAEMAMFHSKSGEMVDFIKAMGNWNDSWQPRGADPIASAITMGLLKKNDLAVHLVKADQEGLRKLSNIGVKPCLCPRSNDYLGNGQPNVDAMLKLGMKPVLGTDSLASNDSLNMIDEIRFAMQEWEATGPLDILRMATTNISELVPRSVFDQFYPLGVGGKKPIIELLFEDEIDDPFVSLKSGNIVEQNIYV